MLGNSISVVFTEYQLLQVEAICHSYIFNKSDLIIPNIDRVNENLVNKNMFNEIYYLPKIYEDGSIRKLSFNYLNRYQKIVKEHLKKNKYNIIIGAADENTAMSIIKNYLNSEEYWSIEDGIGNYREFGFNNDLKIFFKKLLFNYIYQKDIQLLAQKGGGRNSKSFRIAPELTINKGSHYELSELIKKYLYGHSKFYSKLINKSHNYTKVVVVDLEVKNYKSLKDDGEDRVLIKKHPKYLDETNRFSIQNLPLEVLPMLFNDIKEIVYDSYFCSSILNILTIYDDISIKITFDINKKYKNNNNILIFINKLLEIYNNRIEIVKKLDL